MNREVTHSRHLMDKLPLEVTSAVQKARLGFRDLRMKVALKKYLDKEFSLCRASEFAGVSIQQMARYLAERGIQFFRQTVEESMRDAKVAEDWLKYAGTD